MGAIPFDMRQEEFIMMIITDRPKNRSDRERADRR